MLQVLPIQSGQRQTMAYSLIATAEHQFATYATYE